PPFEDRRLVVDVGRQDRGAAVLEREQRPTLRDLQVDPEVGVLDVLGVARATCAGQQRDDEQHGNGQQPPRTSHAPLSTTFQSLSTVRCSRPPLAKPASVIPAAWAASTARFDGALTATTAANPPAQAFCTISKLARPLT